MKTTWFQGADRQQFAKVLAAADYRHQPGELFTIFLECATASLRQAVHRFLTGELDPELEQEYMRAIGRVQHADKLAHAMAILTTSLEAEQYDFLGTFSGEVGLNDKKYAGQCFTPRDVCRMMAKMTVHDMSKRPDRTVWVSEPACGGGAMLIAVAGELFNNGWSRRDVHFVAEDISRRCFQMAYVQTTLLGIPAVVCCGNSLSGERFDTARNLISHMCPPWDRSHPVPTCSEPGDNPVTPVQNDSQGPRQGPEPELVPVEPVVLAVQKTLF